MAATGKVESLPPPADDEKIDFVGIGDGRLLKMDVDYADQVADAIPKAMEIAKTGTALQALESLYPLEKQTRIGMDMKSNAQILQAMVRICFDAGDYTLLNDTIMTMSKKRLLIKQAVARMVRDSCEMVPKIVDQPTQQKLIDTLRTVTAGKIYVEVERARLTYRLVKRLESEGKLDEATIMLLELQVETYGSMEMKEKVEYLLEQMRLCVARKDFIRASIVAKKISVRFFNDDKSNEVQQMKLRYYRLMIEIGQHESAYLDICRHYRAIYDTPCIQEDSIRLEECLKNVVLYVLLAPHDNEQSDLLGRIKEIRNLEKVPDYKKLLDLFTVDEIISWKEVMQKGYESILRKGTKTSPATDVFDGNTETGEKRWRDLHVRVGEHNMRMIAKYYTQIKFDRMAQLLDFSIEEMEEFLSNLIVSGVIPNAKVDRPKCIVDFAPRNTPIETLDQWAISVKKLTDILNKVSHQILKEEMVHRHLHSH